ncbi:MAG: hypothetical protein R2940_16755 [Syntrophotaleaceae bacterium]
MTAIETRLQELCRSRGWSSIPAVCALDFGGYQLLQVVPPEVPDNELREALRWQIRDLIDFPLEEAVIDVFHVPRGNQRERARTAYVVVAQRNLIRQRVAQMTDARLKVQAIDIPELVLRNLACLFHDTDRAAGLLFFGPDSGLLIVTRGQELCLARNLPVGVSLLQERPDFLERTVETVALEIQRSFDFYERSFAQAPIASLAVAPQDFDTEPLLAGLRASLGIEVSSLDLEKFLECPDPLPPNAGQCLLAIGAALRNEEEG